MSKSSHVKNKVLVAFEWSHFISDNKQGCGCLKLLFEKKKTKSHINVGALKNVLPYL